MTSSKYIAYCGSNLFSLKFIIWWSFANGQFFLLFLFLVLGIIPQSSERGVFSFPKISLFCFHALPKDLFLSLSLPKCFCLSFAQFMSVVCYKRTQTKDNLVGIWWFRVCILLSGVGSATKSFVFMFHHKISFVETVHFALKTKTDETRILFILNVVILNLCLTLKIRREGASNKLVLFSWYYLLSIPFISKFLIFIVIKITLSCLFHPSLVFVSISLSHTHPSSSCYSFNIAHK